MIQVISPSRARVHTYTEDMLLNVPFYSAMLLVPHILVSVIFTSEFLKKYLEAICYKSKTF